MREQKKEQRSLLGKGRDCGIEQSLAWDNVWFRGMDNMVVPGKSERALNTWKVAQRGTMPILQLWLEPTLVVTLTKAKNLLQLINKSNYIPKDRRRGKAHSKIVLVRCYTQSTLNGSNHRNGIKIQNSCQRLSQGRADPGPIILLGAGYYNNWQICDLIEKRFLTPHCPLNGMWMVLIVFLKWLHILVKDTHCFIWCPIVRVYKKT